MGTIVSDPDKSDVEKVCGEFLRAFQGALSWKWDGRFETVLAEFGVDNKDSIRAILERHLGTMWDSSSIAGAPDIVRTVNIRVARLRAGQLLFTSDPNRDALVFVPGGHGATGKPFLSASRHSLENCQLQKRLRKSNYLKADSGFR
jgi:hypothetical protein